MLPLSKLPAFTAFAPMIKGQCLRCKKKNLAWNGLDFRIEVFTSRQILPKGVLSFVSVRVVPVRLSVCQSVCSSFYPLVDAWKN